MCKTLQEMTCKVVVLFCQLQWNTSQVKCHWHHVCMCQRLDIIACCSNVTQLHLFTLSNIILVGLTVCNLWKKKKKGVVYWCQIIRLIHRITFLLVSFFFRKHIYWIAPKIPQLLQNSTLTSPLYQGSPTPGAWTGTGRRSKMYFIFTNLFHLIIWRFKLMII